MKVNQRRPSAVAWALWRKANRIWSYPTGELHQQLGEWTIQLQRYRHFAYLQPYRQSFRLYLRFGNEEYTICVATRNQANLYGASDRSIPFAQILPDAQSVEVEPTPNPNRWLVLSPVRPSIFIPRQPITETFEAFIQTLEPWEEELLQHTQMKVDPNTLCNMLSHGIEAASDGSVRFETQGAFGWMLSNDPGERLASGMGPARGYRPTSYRAEGYGILSLLRFLIQVSEYTHTAFEPWKGTLQTVKSSVMHIVDHHC